MLSFRSTPLDSALQKWGFSLTRVILFSNHCQTVRLRQLYASIRSFFSKKFRSWVGKLCSLNASERVIFRLKVQNKISTRSAVNRLSLALMGWTFDAYFICHMHAKTCTCNCTYHNFLIEAFSYSVKWSAVSQSLTQIAMSKDLLAFTLSLSHSLSLYSDTDIFLSCVGTSFGSIVLRWLRVRHMLFVAKITKNIYCNE